MKRFGLIGKTLKHSFSKKYFTDKFEAANITDCQYELFELNNISEFPELLKKLGNQLAGLNVTIPYKQEVMQYLDELDPNAKSINAVNTIKKNGEGQLVGYNTDYSGFRASLSAWDTAGCKALVLGTGGASKAVEKVLTDLSISYQMVSRNAGVHTISYDQLLENQELVSDSKLIINTTPLGTYPNVKEKPALPYPQIGSEHMLFDLVYNPEVTAFMQEGLDNNARVKNGYEMLVGQAEAAWKIWND